jgi:APA family basic amino acid/polyamine antiporter
MRRWDLVAVVLNGVIGAGIFGLPSRVFGLVGSYSLVSFGVCALCVIPIVLSFCEVASRYSRSGGPYLYARETYGSAIGFTVGWLLWIARVTSFAANCSLLPEYLDLFFPGAASGLARALIISVVVAALAAVNITGVRRVANTSNTFAIGKLLPLAIFIVAGFFFLDPARFHFAATPGYRPFSQSVLLLVYAFTGFEMAVIPAGESKNPQRHLPMALIIGMTTVVVFYVLIQIVCIGTLGELASSRRPLADAAAQFSGTWGGAMITAGLTISLAGNLNILILTASRVIFAMAEYGDMPAALRTIHPQYRTPVVAILFTTVIVFALTLSGTFIYLITLSTLARLIYYFATCAAVPILRRRTGSPPAAFLIPAGAATAAAGMVLAVWLFSNSSWREVRDTAIAALLGIGIYWLQRRLTMATTPTDVPAPHRG